MDFNQLLTALATNSIGAACAAAVLWFAYYRETKTLPALMQTFTDAHLANVASFEGRTDKLLDTFANVMREERAVCQKWHEENRQGLSQLLAEVKEQRHLILNLSFQAGLQKQVKDELKKRAEEGKEQDKEE